MYTLMSRGIGNGTVCFLGRRKVQPQVVLLGSVIAERRNNTFVLSKANASRMLFVGYRHTG